jgi:hypothetical protein
MDGRRTAAADGGRRCLRQWGGGGPDEFTFELRTHNSNSGLTPKQTVRFIDRSINNSIKQPTDQSVTSTNRSINSSIDHILPHAQTNERTS